MVSLYQVCPGENSQKTEVADVGSGQLVCDDCDHDGRVSFALVRLNLIADIQCIFNMTLCGSQFVPPTLADFDGVFDMGTLFRCKPRARWENESVVSFVEVLEVFCRILPCIVSEMCYLLSSHP